MTARRLAIIAAAIVAVALVVIAPIIGKQWAADFVGWARTAASSVR